MVDVPSREEFDALESRVSALEGPSPPPPGAAVPFFRDDFQADWQATVGGSPQDDAPAPWSQYYKDGGNAYLKIEDGRLQSGYRWPAAQAGRVAMIADFTPRDQIHLRAKVRYSDTWDWGVHPTGLQLQKLCRFWQADWQSGEKTSGWIIPRITGRPDANGRMEFKMGVGANYRGNPSDSNDHINGASIGYDAPLLKLGVIADVSDTTGWTNPGWFTIDLFLKLSEPQQDNGVVRWWVDGTEILDKTVSKAYLAEFPITGDGLVTEATFGGISRLMWAENCQGIQSVWTRDGAFETDFIELYDAIPTDLS